MRTARFTVAVTLLTAASLALPAGASTGEDDPILDAADCLLAPEGVHQATDPDSEGDDDSDRGYGCVSDGNPANGVEYYLGGEARTEFAYTGSPQAEPAHQAGEECGVVVVAGQVVSATRADDPATAEDERLDFDYVETLADGTTVHHTCD
jgi:hypothetical protein